MYMLIPIDFIILVNYVYADSMDFIMLVNYVYVDSNESYNACKLCICWFYWVLNACKLGVLIQLGFGILVNTMLILLDFWMLVLCGFLMLVNYDVLNACKLCICWFYWVFECL